MDISTHIDTNSKEFKMKEKLMYKKKRFRINTIELILGIIFLGFSFQYLQEHPAERISVFSSIQSMFSKVENITGGIFGSDIGIQEQKKELEALYIDLLSAANQDTCSAEDLKKQITVRLNQLNNMTQEEYAKQHSGFRTNLEIYANQLVQQCPATIE